MAKPILLLRAASDAAPMAEALERSGYQPILNPLIEHISEPEAQAKLDALRGVDGLILTSAHALDNVVLPDATKLLTCYCVGQRTAAAALKAGVKNCEIFPSAKALADALKEADVTCPLYLRGEHITQPFDGATEVITYRAEAIMVLNHHAKELLNKHSKMGVTFTSARLVHLFSLLLEELHLEHLKETIIAFCLSEPIAVNASAYGYKSTYSADVPDLKSLYSVIEKYY